MKLRWKGKRITVTVHPWWAWLRPKTWRFVRQCMNPLWHVTDGEAAWTESDGTRKRYSVTSRRK